MGTLFVAAVLGDTVNYAVGALRLFVSSIHPGDRV